ncbi:hypothetical protein KR009_005612 [Drosophila setifemur]|nr:hypothetical protein KR009_005612 [Drosophila setifemur]
MDGDNQEQGTPDKNPVPECSKYSGESSHSSNEGGEYVKRRSMVLLRNIEEAYPSESSDDEEDAAPGPEPKRPSWAPADPNTAIEISSSSVEVGGDLSASSESDEEDDDEVDDIEDPSSLSDSDSDVEKEELNLKRSFGELLRVLYKPYSDLVKLCELAFKLKDLKRIEVALLALDKGATVPAHIWLKYLKTCLVVTQTDQERDTFEEKCAKALKYHYNVPLAEFIVDYLIGRGEVENKMLWANLLADYDVERPDIGQKLLPLINKLQDEKEATAVKFQDLVKEHCVSWELNPELRNTIKSLVDEFKRCLEESKTQHSDWDWAKLHGLHVEKALELGCPKDVQNAVVRFIFERCVAKFPTADALWLEYLRFTLGTDKDEDAEKKDSGLVSRLGRGFLSNQPVELVKRAVKCRPSIRLNHKFLHVMEHADFEVKQVDEEIAELLPRMVNDMEMTVELHLDYLAYRVRNTKTNDEEAVASLRAAFQKCWDDLSASYGDQADTRYEIMQLWAQVEYSRLSNPTSGALIWRQIMGYPGANQSGHLWLSYAQMESEYNVGLGTRAILQAAMAQPLLDNGYLIQDYYRRFERCYGTCDSIAECQEMKLPPAHYTKPRQQGPPMQRKQVKVLPTKKAPESAKPAAQRANLEAKNKPKLAPKAKGAVVSEQRDSIFKYSTDMEANKVFVKNVPPSCSKQTLQDLFAPYGQIKDVRLVQKM